MRPGVPLPIVKGRDDREAHPGARTGSLGALGQWAGIGPHGANGDPRLHREMARCYHSPVTRKVLNALLVALTLIGLSAGPAASIAAMCGTPGRGAGAPAVAVGVGGTTAVDAEKFFRQFTPKQNAVLQMLMGGTANEEIGHRLGVALNTAKVHVRLVARKLGVHSRAQVAVKALPFFDAIDPETYKNATRGLPKDWHEQYEEPDPYRNVYVNGGDEK